MTDQEIKTKIIPMAKGITEEVKKAVIGKDEIVIKTLLAILAGGPTASTTSPARLCAAFFSRTR